MKDLKNDNEGSIVVEACISLVAFIAVLVSLTCLINVFIVHNRIQFAINSSANQIAAYSYLYEMSSVGEARDTLKKDGAPYMEKFDTVKRGIGALSNIFNKGNAQSFSSLQSNVGLVATGAEELISDPYSVAIGVLYSRVINGEQVLEDKAVGTVGKLLTRQYIAPGKLDADEYLTRHYIHGGYSGLNFGKSEFTHEKGNDGKVIVVIDVTYEIEIPLIRFMLPDNHTLTVHQRACAKGWTCGDGQKPKNLKYPE